MTTIDQNQPISKENPSDGFSLLPDWGLIFVEGPDAANFLQNQLTNSVLGLKRTLSPNIAQGYAEVRLAGYCSPKGRLLASAWISLAPSSESSDDRFALFISKDIAQSISKRLSMYVLRSKVKVTDVSNEWIVTSHHCPVDQFNTLSLDQNTINLRLPDVHANGQNYARVLIAQSSEANSAKLNEKIALAWGDLEVLSAIPRIVLATQEQFVPQMINFESVAGIDFKKGCYPGQEIVARSQYRGAIKRRLALAHAAGTPDALEQFKPGVEIFHSEDISQPAGMVVLSSLSSTQPNRIDLQIECKLEALEHGEILLGSADGPVLKIDPLPYPLIEI